MLVARTSARTSIRTSYMVRFYVVVCNPVERVVLSSHDSRLPANSKSALRTPAKPLNKWYKFYDGAQDRDDPTQNGEFFVSVQKKKSTPKTLLSTP